MAAAPSRTNRTLYVDDNPLDGTPFDAKVSLLAEIDAYARAKEPRVRQVMASLLGEWQVVQIVRADGSRAADVRPLVRLNVLGHGGRGRAPGGRLPRGRRARRL